MNATTFRSAAAHLQVLALASSLAWILAVLLVATQASREPAGADYDTYNRLLSVALILVLATAIGMRSRVAARALPGTGAALALVIGLVLMLAGNVVEFWGALIAGALPAATAARTGGPEFWGSTPGFLAFLIGQITVALAMIQLGIRARRWPGASPRTTVAIGMCGVLFSASTAAWAVSPAVALLPAALFAVTWVILARATATE